MNPAYRQRVGQSRCPRASGTRPAPAPTPGLLDDLLVLLLMRTYKLSLLVDSRLDLLPLGFRPLLGRSVALAGAPVEAVLSALVLDLPLASRRLPIELWWSRHARDLWSVIWSVILSDSLR